MWRIIGILPFYLFILLPLSAQTYETQFRRSVSDVMRDVAERFEVRFKYDANVDTVGVTLPYADFRIRPYSIEQTLDNICKYFDWNWWKQSGNLYKIKRYEYPRRHEDEGRQMLEYLSAKYSNVQEWELRRSVLIKEVRERLQIDAFLDSCVKDAKPILSSIRKHDGYTTQNICIELIPGQHVFGTIYSSLKKGKKPLIVCPDGHWPSRYRDDEQQRLATLARMGAVCVDFDLYGYSQSEAEVGDHHSARAHIFQAACGLKLLDYMLTHRKDIDHTRVAANGGSGGGTHTVLLAILDSRITASAPVVHVASHFDGGCPCESGMPVQLAGGGTCEAELAAIIAPKPLLLVSDGGDWTSTNPELEYPFIQRIFGFYDAEQNMRCSAVPLGYAKNVHLPMERHDFGPNKRQAVYDFFIDVFGLDRSMLDESKVTIESPETMQTKLP